MYVYKGKTWYENSDKYSVSTSKQQTQLRPKINGFEFGFIKKTTEELKQIIRGGGK